MITISRPSFVAALALAVVARPPHLRAQDAVRPVEAFAAGDQYHVSSRVELSGSLALPPDKGKAAGRQLAVSGDSAVEYDERVLGLGAGGRVEKTVRLYRRVEFRRKVGQETQDGTVRPAVRRMVVLRLGSREVPFSPDGALTWGEIDLVRTDVFTPALAGLLPVRPVRPGERWQASADAIQELTDMERIDEGRVECQFQETATLEGRPYARVAFSGSVRGTNEDGPNRQELNGYLFFDLRSSHVSYVSLKGTHILLDRDGKEVGRVQGRFVLTRQAPHRTADLSDEALRDVALEPNTNNTLLLYEDQTAGVRFLYPRRWRVASSRGRQVALDESRGSGLLLTFEPLAGLPTGEQFRAETTAYLTRQKLKIVSTEPVRRLDGGLEHFALDADEPDGRVVLDYYVVRLAVGGATLAARLRPADAPALRKEIEQLARSIVLSREPRR